MVLQTGPEVVLVPDLYRLVLGLFLGMVLMAILDRFWWWSWECSGDGEYMYQQQSQASFLAILLSSTYC